MICVIISLIPFSVEAIILIVHLLCHTHVPPYPGISLFSSLILPSISFNLMVRMIFCLEGEGCCQ